MKNTLTFLLLIVFANIQASDLIEKLGMKKTMFRNDQIINVLEQIKETGLELSRY